MKKIAFIGNSEPPERLLELFRKMTPNNSGIWKNLVGVDNYREAEVFGVIDSVPAGLGIDETKCVFLGAHPESMHAYRDMSRYRGIKMYDCKETFGFGEWWLKYDYDYLSALKPMRKPKQIGAIVSDATSQDYHKKRIAWLQRFTDRPDLISFDLYGRIKPRTVNMQKFYKGPCGSYDPRGHASSGGNDHMCGKEEVYEEHVYMIEFDATGANYFSERVFDCLLLWAMPIYWGGAGLHKYIPAESFRYLDIGGSGDDVKAILNEHPYDKALPYIAKARDLLLNKYQIWARCHEAIFGEP